MDRMELDGWLSAGIVSEEDVIGHAARVGRIHPLLNFAGFSA